MAFNPNISGSDPQYLYVAFGDGGSANDPGNRAQDITSQLLGKIVRIDVNGDDFTTDPNRNYSIPSSNPFVGITGDDEIWSFGLRNPWRNSFDRKTGDMWVADVGQNAREEVNFEPAGSGGRNYGWKVMEGGNCFDNSGTGGNPPCNSPLFTPPVHTYGHVNGTTGGFSITGGYVYRGSVAQYEGLYFFGDFVNNNFWTIDPYATNITATVRNRNSELPLSSGGGFAGIASFGEDGRGELYYSDLGNGRVFRLQSTAQRATWNGDSAVGTAGDGIRWTDANNWTRGSTIDAAIVAKDEAVFVAGSSTSLVNLEGARTVGGIRFESSYTLEGGTLNVLSGNVHVGTGAIARLNATLAAETSAASLRKLGPGHLITNGTTGQVVVLEGSLGGTGTLNNLRVFAGGAVRPGDGIGTLRVTNAFRQVAGTELEIDISNSLGGGPLTNDLLQVSGAAEIGGALVIAPDDAMYVDPSIPGTVEVYTVLTALSLQGRYATLEFDGAIIAPDFIEANGSFRTHIDDGLFRGVVYVSTPSTGSVAFQNYRALPGDANGDGVVDGVDFNIWNANKFQAGTRWTSGDFNDDGVTDGADFGIWNANKFTSVDGLLVPEPSSLVLPCLLLLCGARRRRR
jgi:Glucose / Sorbosone dehydrogenase